MTCKDHDFPTAICVKCASDGVAECVCTLPCQECEAPPPADAEQCELHQGEPCAICTAPVSEPCNIVLHWGYELDLDAELRAQAAKEGL